jgi:hypothetical protein
MLQAASTLPKSSKTIFVRSLKDLPIQENTNTTYTLQAFVVKAAKTFSWKTLTFQVCIDDYFSDQTTARLSLSFVCKLLNVEVRTLNTEKKLQKYIKERMNELLDCLASMDGLLDIVIVSDIKSNMKNILEVVNYKKINSADSEKLFNMYTKYTSSMNDQKDKNNGCNVKKRRISEPIDLLDDSSDDD